MKPSKEYNRKTKKWEKATEQVGDLKKPELCKGRREHEWLLTLPEHIIRYRLKRDITPEAINAYYVAEEMRRGYEKTVNDYLATFGFKEHYWGFGSTAKHYICSVCGKKKIEYNDKKEF